MEVWTCLEGRRPYVWGSEQPNHSEAQVPQELKKAFSVRLLLSSACCLSHNVINLPTGYSILRPPGATPI